MYRRGSLKQFHYISGSALSNSVEFTFGRQKIMSFGIQVYRHQPVHAVAEVYASLSTNNEELYDNLVVSGYWGDPIGSDFCVTANRGFLRRNVRSSTCLVSTILLIEKENRLEREYVREMFQEARHIYPDIP
jgi:hypothetical protein